ncbi:MAG: hypothetical protein GQ565_07255 [Candidatus Aegiribacteria sp.]|nr:hypothetical protein [Candidatus Aegiribacteria sp.]
MSTQETPDIAKFTFDDRLGMMLDREVVARDNRLMTRRLKQAGFKHKSACMEDIDYRSDRGIDRSLMMSLASCRWIHDHLGILISTPRMITEGFSRLRRQMNNFCKSLLNKK